MKILYITDIHNNIKIISSLIYEISSSDLIIIGGDITNFGCADDAKNIIKEIEKYNKNVLAVTGNCDNIEIEHYLKFHNINLHKNVIKHNNNIIITGISGSLTTPFNTPNEYTVNQFNNITNKICTMLGNSQKIKSKDIILVTHQPPIDTINDTINKNMHLGSKAIRQLIEKISPLICLTGHIHEGIGIDKIDNTAIVNPGPAKDGYFAIIQLNKNNIDDIKLNKIQ